MAEAGLRTGIKKLNGENYPTWSYKVELLLIKDKLWDVVTKPLPDAEAQAKESWASKNDEARATIGLLVEDDQLMHIRSATTAKATWEALKEYHQKSTLTSKVFLLKSLCRSALKDNGDMEEHIFHFSSTVAKLSALGQDLPDDLQAALLLSSLPESYETLVTALEGRSEKELTSQFVKSKLIDEFKRRKAVSEAKGNEDYESALKITEARFYKEKECYWCKEKGHFKRECEGYLQWKEKQENLQEKSQSGSGRANTAVWRDSEFCFYSTDVGKKAKSNAWVIDSAASSHMTNDNNFLEFTDSKKYVTFGNGHQEVSFGKGTKLLNLILFNRIYPIKIQNALFVPKLSCNILSVKVLSEKGFSVMFEKDTCIIRKENQTVGIAVKKNGFYELVCKEPESVQKEYTSKEPFKKVFNKKSRDYSIVEVEFLKRSTNPEEEELEAEQNRQATVFLAGDEEEDGIQPGNNEHQLSEEEDIYFEPIV